jgi:hypothetical protein
MVEEEGGIAVLSTQEQQIWEDVERYWEETVDEVLYDEALYKYRAEDVRRELARGDLDDAPSWAMVGLRVAIFLVLLGIVAPGLAIAGASLGAWALWHLLRTRTS